MALLRQALLGLFVLFAPSFLQAADWIFVLPSAGGPITVIRPGDFSIETTIPAPTALSTVIQDVDGAFYYLLSKQTGPGLTVIDSETLEVETVIALGAGAQDAAATPDGRYILVAAGSLVVIDAVEHEVVASLSVGSGPTEVVVDPSSDFAYVLAGSSASRRITVVDLDTLSVVDEIQRSQVDNIALTGAGATLLAVRRQDLAAYSTETRQELASVSAATDFDRATIHPLPGGQKAIVQATGTSPDNTSYLIDYVNETTQQIGTTGQSELAEIIVDGTDQAFGILDDDRELVQLDLTAEDDIPIEPLGLSIAALDLGLSPNHRELFVTANGSGSIVKIDTNTNEVLKTTTLPTPPKGQVTLFAPSDLPPFNFLTIEGDGQFVPPGVELVTPLSVMVTDELDQPIANETVLFEDPSGFGFTFLPGPEVQTNEDGVATVRVRVPARENLPPDPGTDIEPVAISASTSEVLPLFFNVNVLRSIGLVKISGDHQIVESQGFFHKDFVVLATDEDGIPIPEGTSLQVLDIAAECPFPAIVDSAGFVNLERCRAEKLSAVVTQKKGAIILNGPGGTRAQFDFTIALGADRVGIEKISGDDQTGAAGDPLLAPLVYQPFNTGLAGIAQVFAEARQVSGPIVQLDPRTTLGNPNIPRDLNVTLGDSGGGTAVIEIEVPAPNLPTVQFTVNVIGASPTGISGTNGGQTGKLFTTLDLPLIATVQGDSGGVMPYPEVIWTVESGEASTRSLITSTNSRATVTLGGLAGPVSIRASLGELSTVFTVNAEGPEPDEMQIRSGQGQTLEPGQTSEPVEVRVFEDNLPAAGAIVTFSGPPTLLFYPLEGGEPANPIEVNANLNGDAAARVEIVNVSGITEQGSGPAQGASGLTATISSGTVSVMVPFGVIGRPPEFDAGSIVNAASFQPGGLVPGALISIFGHGFMEGIAEVVETGGVTSFEGTSVTIDGVLSPLLALAPGPTEQINLQVPFEVTPGRLVDITVNNNGTMTTVNNVAVFSAQPGIFEVPVNGGLKVGAALHVDGALVTEENPAQKGEPLLLFYTGGGRLEDPGVPTGELGPADPPGVIKANSIVRVDNVSAEILFSGYAPGFLGLNQTNFVVPEEGISCGPLSLAILLNDIESPGTNLPVACD